MFSLLTLVILVILINPSNSDNNLFTLCYLIQSEIFDNVMLLIFVSLTLRAGALWFVLFYWIPIT